VFAFRWVKYHPIRFRLKSAKMMFWFTLIWRSVFTWNSKKSNLDLISRQHSRRIGILIINSNFRSDEIHLKPDLCTWALFIRM
jgi:hypothetical protein